MPAPAPAASVYRFGPFELNARKRELRKHGVRIRLQDQPLQLLLLLLERRGEILTRQQIQDALWPPGVHVDYDNAINSAMRKLREALGDTSERPRYIETFARRGYQFIGHTDAPQHRVDDQVVASPPPTKKAFRIGTVSAVSLAFLVAATVAGLWLLSRREAKAVPLRPVPLTSARGRESKPSFSPDGSQLAYSWDEGARYDRGPQLSHIYVKLIGEGKPLRVTAGANADWSPAWSPDGRSIAFVRDLGSISRIYVIPALGGTERQIAEGHFASRDFHLSAISWSPEGRFLAMAERTSPESPSFLSLIGIETGERVRLTTPADPRAADEDPVFSPDGRALLFTRCDNRCGLYVLRLGRDYRPLGVPRSLNQEGQLIKGAVWTPDGKDIVYALYERGYAGHLMRVRADGGTQAQRLPFAGDTPLSPAIAPRGNRLAYTAEILDVQIWQVRPGEAPRNFGLSSGMDVTPQYSPDGTRIVFASDRSGFHQIWISDSDGGNPIQLTHFDEGDSGTPRWSPDGRSIAFDHFAKDGMRVFVIAADGRRLRRVTKENFFEAIPSWSGDGKWIYYASDRTGRLEIWKAPAEGGNGIRITRHGGYTAFECPVRKSLFYTKEQTPGIWSLSLETGEEQLVLPSGGGEREFTVMPDGIYYLTPPRPDGIRSVRFHRFATGKEEEIASINVETFEGLAVSPDRHTILFTAAVQFASSVMVVDNFH